MKCSLVTFVIASVLVLPAISGAAIGLFVDSETRCRIRSPDGTNEEPCRKGTLVQNNDVIETRVGIGRLPIQWLSPRLLLTEKVGKSAYRVGLKKKLPSSSTMNVVADMFAFARRTSLARSRTAARGATAVPPGAAASLLAGYDMTFTWCGTGPVNLRIRDEEGRDVMHVPVMDKGFATVNLRGADLKAGRKYTWVLDGNVAAPSGQVTVTPLVLEKKIVHTLDAIARSEERQGKRALMQAIFLLHAPEIFSSELDYRWLAHDILRQQSIFDDDDRELRDALLEDSGLKSCTGNPE
jgi:hypothetical protein